MFVKAKREQSKLRLALIGPSGSGKTYSALLIAQGLGGGIAMIDTETGSGSLYADLCDYDVAEMKPPFTPEKYTEAIKEAERAGYGVIIIDSLSHAWAGQGGLLEFVDKATQSLKNNFAAWREASPKHNNLVDAMLQSQCHIIGTMRSKTAWEVQKDERTGKTRPVKVGLAPVQRDGLEYEFTSVLELSVDGHIATASKDRTSLFDNQYFVPGIETGETLRAWLQGSKGNGGQKQSTEPEAPQELPAAKPTGKVTQLRDVSRADLLSQVFGQLREIGLADKIAEYERYVLHKYVAGVKDLPADSLEEQVNNLERCKDDYDLSQKFSKYLTRLQVALGGEARSGGAGSPIIFHRI